MLKTAKCIDSKSIPCPFLKTDADIQTHIRTDSNKLTTRERTTLKSTDSK
jgi:hypothetical protein